MTAERHASRRRGGTPLLVALCLAALAYGIQQTLVLPALPVLQSDLHASTAWTSWIVSLFLISSCVANPLLGRLGDQHGRRRMLLVALGLFFAGSLVAMLAPNIGVLVAARALQGAGGAVLPLAAAIVRDEYPASRVGFLVGVVYSTVAAATALGFVASGILLDHVSWRYLFAAGSIPLVVGLVLLWRYLPESEAAPDARSDIPGAILLSGALLAGLLGVTEGNAWGWHSARTTAAFALSAVLTAVWTSFERRASQPLVDIRMLVRRPVLLTNACALGLGMTTFCAFTLVPRFAETGSAAGYGFAASATAVGLYISPGFVLGLFTGPLFGLLGRRMGTGPPIVIGCLVMAAGCATLAKWHSHPWQIVIAMLLLGSGWPAATGSITVAILSVVHPDEAGVAAGITQVSRQVGGAIGTQVGAAVLVGSLHGTVYPSLHAYVVVFTLGAVMSGAAAFLALLVRSGGGPLPRGLPATSV